MTEDFQIVQQNNLTNSQLIHWTLLLQIILIIEIFIRNQIPMEGKITTYNIRIYRWAKL